MLDPILWRAAVRAVASLLVQKVLAVLFRDRPRPPSPPAVLIVLLVPVAWPIR